MSMIWGYGNNNGLGRGWKGKGVEDVVGGIMGNGVEAGVAATAAAWAPFPNLFCTVTRSCWKGAYASIRGGGVEFTTKKTSVNKVTDSWSSLNRCWHGMSGWYQSKSHQLTQQGIHLRSEVQGGIWALCSWVQWHQIDVDCAYWLLDAPWRVACCG